MGAEPSIPALHMYISPSGYTCRHHSIWEAEKRRNRASNHPLLFPLLFPLFWSPFPLSTSFVDKSTHPCLLPNLSSVITPLIIALYPPNNTIAIAEERIPIIQDLLILFLQIIPLRAAVLGLQR